MPNIQFQFRRGTSTEWSTANPVLAAGEMGIETNTNLFKVGNGSTAWNSLSYGGIQGNIGPIGATGPQGGIGATGPQGNIGPIGATGVSSVVVYDETTLVTSSAAGFRFIGNTVTASLVSGNVEVTVTSTATSAVEQSDIGTGPNEIPLNQYLGMNAYVDTETPALNVGTGITTGTGTICKANGGLSGGIYRVTVLINLTGLNSGGTAGDIIGVNGTALPCYIAQLPAMTVLGGRMTCLEAPVGGDTDIDLYAATEGTGVEDQAVSALTETEIINAGVQSRGTVTYFSAYPATNSYLYLVGQGTANTIYTAGRFLIELFGI